MLAHAIELPTYTALVYSHDDQQTFYWQGPAETPAHAVQAATRDRSAAGDFTVTVIDPRNGDALTYRSLPYGARAASAQWRPYALVAQVTREGALRFEA